MKVSDLKPSPHNPRIIGKKALTGLGFSLEEFGDLSGIVFNTKTGNLVCGHQRVKAIEQVYGKEVEVKDNVITTSGGHTFSVRMVEWSLEKEMAANAVANNQHIQGEWEDDKLKDVLAQAKEHDEALFNNLLLNRLELDVQAHELKAPTKEWEFGEVYRPFWIVIRGPIENIQEVKKILEKAQQINKRIKIETSENE